MRTSALLLLSSVALSCATSSPLHAPAPARAEASALPFIENDYVRALADARTKGVPLFVEAWANW